MPKLKPFIYQFLVLFFVSALILISLPGKTRAHLASGKYVKLAPGEGNIIKQAANKAARVEIITNRFEQEINGDQAPEGWRFAVLETRWENIHPKQKIEKDKLEGKADQTMGVKTLAQKKEKKKEDYVEVDVAYMIEKIIDHAYLLADGLAFSLHRMTEDIQGGADLEEAFMISKFGETRSANFVYLIPEGAENIGFRFFDYEYGHIDIPIQGNIKKALGTEGLAGEVISRVKSDTVELVVHSFDFRDDYDEEEAPEDWRYAVIHLSGKSFLGQRIKDIIQIEPKEYTWVTTEGGYFYYCEGATTTYEGMIRFTPEVYQHQELAFLVPASDQLFQLGIRIQNDILMIDLSEKKPKGFPKSIASHQDGDIMEVMLFGVRKENGKIILDLGIQSLTESGLEIQTEPQFILLDGDKKIYIDDEVTEALPHRPPYPFIIPPQTFIRFELAYSTDSVPSIFYFRGFESEKYMELPHVTK